MEINPFSNPYAVYSHTSINHDIGARSGSTGYCIGSRSLNRHTMVVEQITECLLVEIRTHREKKKKNIDAHQRYMKE
jgi:hypothetical protein